jgi:chemotaxis protein methyltransferase CheR
MTPEHLAYVAELVLKHSGVVLRNDRAFFVETRLGPVARKEKQPGVEALLDELKRTDDPVLTRAVVEATLMQETGFFRDRKVFEQLEHDILPAMAQRRGGKGVRILSAGCATGQEAYSIAMAAMDSVPTAHVEVLGVDFGGRALEKARSGLYTHFEVQRGLRIQRLLTYFEKVEENWRAAPRLRQAVIWRDFNLLDELHHLGHFDIILCRNVLGAFAPDVAAETAEALDAQLAPDGVLVLGCREEITLPAAYAPSGEPGVFLRNAGYSRDALSA